MPSDKGHRLTEEELSALSRRISDMYKQAADELTDTINGYFAQFNKRDERMRGLIGQTVDGREWTEQDYKRWRLNQMGRGERYRALQQKLASRMTDANEVAMAYINDVLPGIYTLNRNYSAYKIEGAAGSADFTLWDEAAVRRLATEQPDLMPYYPPKRAIKRKIDLDWGKKQITKSVTSGLLQGKSTGKIASDLKARIEGMNRDSAVRAARTAITGAENAGRMDTYAAAQKMGIKLKKEWLATLDNRTRHAHAMLDGQKADVDKPFRVDGREIRFPGDPQAHPSLVYNCRCTLVSQVDGADTSGGQRRARDPATGKSVAVSDMSFSEWEARKKAENATAWEAYIKKGENLSADRKQHEEYRRILGDKVPAELDDFQYLKYNESEKWKMLKLDKQRRTTLINNPDLALPGKMETIPQEKFTDYLFNRRNPSGWAKGQAFASRLGYSADNWDELRREIASGAKIYPATRKSHTQYGDLYEQKMILYGKTGRPANVVVGWIYKPDKSTSMTTAYIKEV